MFTNKTQFLFRIEKGVLDVNDSGVNDYFPPEDIRVPFRNMVYIGDSDTDVPCMKLVNSYGGHAIGVYNGDTNKVHKMMRDNRIKYYAEADYSENSDIDKLVKAIIDRTATNEVLENAHYECKNQTEKFDKQNSEEEIQKMPDDLKNGFEIFPALGTPEADEKKKERGIEVTHNNDLSKEITCKTGVVFGLLDNRQGGKIQVFSEVSAEDEAKFEFYIGYEKYEKCKPLIDRNNPDFNKGEWQEISDYADEKSILIYYTSEPRATSEEGMSIEGIPNVTLELDAEYGEDDVVKAKKLSVDSFTYEVFDKNGKQLSNINKEIKLG